MRTAIVIATHQRPEMLRRLLRNLADCPLPAELEVLVVENGPECGVAVVAEEELGGLARYLYLPLGNKSLALNYALSTTAAEFVIFLDDDVSAPPGLVSAYVAAARRHGRGCFFGGGLVAEAERECPPHLAPHLPRSARGWRPAEEDIELAVESFDFFFGANWAAFRADLERAGLFSPTLGVSAGRRDSGGEETDLQARLLAAGLRPIYVADAVIGHPVPAAHYTERWIWQRIVRQGAAEWTAEHAWRPPARAHLLGAPVWLLLRLARERMRRAAAALARAPIEVRTERAMEEARLTGLLLGAVRSRNSQRLTQPRSGVRWGFRQAKRVARRLLTVEAVGERQAGQTPDTRAGRR